MIPVGLGDGGGGFSLFLADAVFELVNLLLGLGLLVADLLLQSGEGGGVVEFGEVLVTKGCEGDIFNSIVRS